MTSAPPPGPAPLDPVSDGSVTSPRGFAAAAVHAGLKADGALDVALLVSATSCDTPGGLVTVGGIAKGAGMIHPDMATLLAVLTTDAVAEPASLQPLLRRVADRSFNAISVDGDTSTNDTALLLANGVSGVDPGRDGAVWKLFEEAVQQVARVLALARGGDGVDVRLDAGLRPDQRGLHVVVTASSCWCLWPRASR